VTSTTFASILASESSRRGARGVLRELQGQLGQLRRAEPANTTGWLKWIAETYGWPTARLTAILLCSYPLDPGVGFTHPYHLIGVASPLADPRALVNDERWNPMMRWIGRELNRVWVRSLRMAKQGELTPIAKKSILAISSPVLQVSQDPNMLVGEMLALERRAMGPLRGNLWLPGDPGDMETEIETESFRDLPEIRDWHNGLLPTPQLSKFTIDTAAEAAEDWHHVLGGITLPRGAVRRGEFVMVHPDSDAEDEDGFWTIQRLTSRHQYEDEGSYMSHCVGGGGYWRAHEQGDIDIYSVRNENGDPTMTLEVKLDADGEPTHIVQVKGKNDETPVNIIMTQSTRTGDDWEMVLSGANAIIEHLEKEHGVKLTRGSDANELQLFTEGEGLAKVIASGDFEINEAIGQQISSMMGEGYDPEIVEAWAKAVEAGYTEVIAPVMAWNQVAMYKDKLPAGMQNLEDIVCSGSDRIDRNGGSDEVTPWIWRFDKVISSFGDAVLKVRGIIVVGYATDGDYDTDSHWFLLADSELRFESMDESFQTSEYSVFDEHYDPEWLIGRKSYTAYTSDRVSHYINWDPDKLHPRFPVRSSRWKEGDRIDLHDVAIDDWEVKFSEVVKKLNEWYQKDCLSEAMEQLGDWQQAAVLGAFPKIDSEWPEMFSDTDTVLKHKTTPGTWRPAIPEDWVSEETNPQRKLFLWDEE